MSCTKKYLDLLDEEEALNRKLFGLKIRKVELSKKVWKECNHEWVVCSDYDDLCKKMCKKCTLYYNHYLYE